MKEDKILDTENHEIKSKTKRNSCLLISSIILILLIVFAYVVTKEVSNAFELVDKGLTETNETYKKTNEALKNVLLKHSEYASTVQVIEKASSEYNSLIDSTINLLIEKTGGWKQDTHQQELANPKNYMVPTKILVKDKLGDRLEESIKKTSIIYNEILKVNLKDDTTELPLKLLTNHIQRENKTWTEYNFDQMPLMAVLPILRKLKSDDNESKSIMYRIMSHDK